MKLIKIIDPLVYETSVKEIAHHLRVVLKRIRLNSVVNDPDFDFKLPENFDGNNFEILDYDLADEIELHHSDESRIRSRASKLSKVRIAAAGLSHLKPEECDRLSSALNGMQIVMAKDFGWADRVAADLHEEMPWMGRATDHLWHVLRRAALRGEPVTLRPVILNGPPGIGKSVWSRSVAAALSIPSVDIDANKGGAGLAVVGVERGWGTAIEGRPVDLMLSKRVANPLVVVDEICMSRAVTSMRGQVHVFADALLSLLEPATAADWECPYFRVKFDMSHISRVLTSNVIEYVPETIRSRCQVIEIPDVTIEQLSYSPILGQDLA